MEFLNILQRFGDLICLVTNNTKTHCIFKSQSHTKLICSELKQLAHITPECGNTCAHLIVPQGMVVCGCVVVDISFSGNSDNVKLGSCVGLVAGLRLLGFKSYFSYLAG